jgi:hypothetical protein
MGHLQPFWPTGVAGEVLGVSGSFVPGFAREALRFDTGPRLQRRLECFVQGMVSNYGRIYGRSRSV